MHRRSSIWLISVALLFASPAAAEEMEGWPRERVATDGTRVVFHQPQIDSWDLYLHLKFHAVAEFYPAGAATAIPAALRLEAETVTDLQARTVIVVNPKVVAASFPDVDEATAAALREVTDGLFPDSSQTLTLDHVLAYFEDPEAIEPTGEERVARPAEFPGDLPDVLVRTSPAILLEFDGEPIFLPIEGSDLEFAVNSGRDVFRHEPTASHFLRYDASWLAAKDLSGPWAPAATMPVSFWSLPDDGNWEEVKQNLPGTELADDAVPEVVVATGPTELILLQGEPQPAPIAGTQLQWITNTEVDLFLHGSESRYYFLGRRDAGCVPNSSTDRGSWPAATCRRTSPRFPSIIRVLTCVLPSRERPKPRKR